MRDKEPYRRILGIEAPWEVSEIELDIKAGEVKVHVEQKPGTKQRCPQCGAGCPGYDKQRRQWRHLHLPTQDATGGGAAPGMQCVEHGVVSVRVPWAEPGRRVFSRRRRHPRRVRREPSTSPNTSSYATKTISSEKLCSMNVRPARPIASRSAGASANMCRIASASDPTSRGRHSKPVSPAINASRQPGASVAITGRAQAAASSSARGMPSR